MAGEYSYTTLPTPGHICLLTLKASKSKSADLHGEIIDYPLQECEGDLHCYEALSYVWGDGKKPRHIWIGTRKLHITESLYDALLCLRSHSADRSLWVDAICINQRDDAEKSVQVQRMANVYSQASRVRVWLGKASSGSDEAIHSLADAGAAEGNFKLSSESLDLIHELLARGWFKRIWVLQEVAAAQHVVLMCGAESIDGYAFCLGLQTLHKSGKLADFPNHIGSIVYLIRRSIFRLGKQSHQALQEAASMYSLNIQPLGQLIDMYRTRQATDQRDKVYALLGMCSDDIPDELLPNYTNTMTWNKLLGNLARYLFGTEANIEIVATDIVAVRSRVKIIGHIPSIRPYENRQDVQVLTTITSWNTEKQMYDKEEWLVPSSAVPVQTDDVICLLEGGHSIAILRPETESFRVITTSGRWGTGYQLCGQDQEKLDEYELLLSWDWTTQQGTPSSFIEPVLMKSALTQDTDGTMRRAAIANTFSSAYLDKKAESSLLGLETELQQKSLGVNSAKLDCAARIANVYLRQGRLDEAEKRYQDVYQYAKATVGAKWLSESIRQYLQFFPVIGYPEKATIWETFKSAMDKNQNLDSPKFYIEIHRKLAANFARGTLADLTMVMNIGETLAYNLEKGMVSPDVHEDETQNIHSIIAAAEEEVVVTLAGNSDGPEVMRLLFEERGNRVQVTENVVVAAAGNVMSALKMMKLLFEKRGDQVPITEKVLMEAVRHPFRGREMMELLFERRGALVLITENVVTAAAKYDHSAVRSLKRGRHKYVRGVMELLFERRRAQIPITGNVVMAAVGNPFGAKIVNLLFEEWGAQVPITGDMIEVAAGNNNNGREIMELLFKNRGDQVTITDNVVVAAAGHGKGREVIELLFEKRGAQVSITENVVIAAVGDFASPGLLKFLFKKKGAQVPITEHVVEGAVGNRFYSWELMKLLFEERGDRVPITEEVVTKVAKKPHGRALMDLLFENRGVDIPITENVIEAAAENWGSGREMIELLFEKSGDIAASSTAKYLALNSAGLSGKSEEVKLLLLEKLEKDAAVLS